MNRTPAANQFSWFGGRQSIGSDGFSCTCPVRPDTNRLNPRIGSITNAPISRQVRPEPVAELSSTSDDIRYSTSPSAMPPMPVLTRSLYDIGWVSPNASQMKAPLSAATEEPQKFTPFARPAL